MLRIYSWCLINVLLYRPEYGLGGVYLPCILATLHLLAFELTIIVNESGLFVVALVTRVTSIQRC